MMASVVLRFKNSPNKGLHVEILFVGVSRSRKQETQLQVYIFAFFHVSGAQLVYTQII